MRAFRKMSAEHLAFQTEENLRAGMSPAEARRQAMLKLGAREAIRQDHHARADVAVHRESFFRSEICARTLRRAPGFTVVAIATMALGRGARRRRIYSVIDATLLHPLPYPNPSELVRVQASFSGVERTTLDFRFPELKDLQNSGIFQYVSVSFFGTRYVDGQYAARANRRESVTPAVLRGAGREAAAGPHVRSERQHAWLQQRTGDQRWALEARVWR